jgi:hypothetical protein
LLLLLELGAEFADANVKALPPQPIDRPSLRRHERIGQHKVCQQFAQLRPERRRARQVASMIITIAGAPGSSSSLLFVAVLF